LFAWSLREPGRLEEEPLDLVEAPDPEPGRGEIRIRVRACGVSPIDVALVKGSIAPPAFPVVPGHQIVGVVDAVGEKVSRFDVGQRAGISRLRETCGACQDCLRGDENLCENARFTGLHADGGLAELAVVRENFAHAIPKATKDVRAAALLEAGVRGLRGLRRTQAGVWENVGLFGFDAAALVVIQILRHRGCRVYVATSVEPRRRRARELGAVWAGDVDEAPPAALDRAVVFEPETALVAGALGAVRRGGRVAVAAASTPIPDLDLTECLAGEKVLTTVAESTREDVSEILRLAAEIPVEPDVREYPFSNVHRALSDVERGGSHIAAVVRVSS
jgi:propanol-preferring alcohol dehydrogenase